MGSFKDVVGHKDILKYISSAVENNRVSHAYILNGERGSGKRMLANLFATTLLCESGNSEPCGKCHSCRQAESGNHPYTGEQYRGYQAVSGTIQSIYYPSGRSDDTAGTKCNSEDDRGAAGICGIFTADGECRDVTSDDQLQMCYAEAA